MKLLHLLLVLGDLGALAWVPSGRAANYKLQLSEHYKGYALPIVAIDSYHTCRKIAGRPTGDEIDGLCLCSSVSPYAPYVNTLGLGPGL